MILQALFRLLYRFPQSLCLKLAISLDSFPIGIFTAIVTRTTATDMCHTHHRCPELRWLTSGFLSSNITPASGLPLVSMALPVSSTIAFSGNIEAQNVPTLQHSRRTHHLLQPTHAPPRIPWHTLRFSVLFIFSTVFSVLFISTSSFRIHITHDLCFLFSSPRLFDSSDIVLPCTRLILFHHLAMYTLPVPFRVILTISGAKEDTIMAHKSITILTLSSSFCTVFTSFYRSLLSSSHAAYSTTVLNPLQRIHRDDTYVFIDSESIAWLTCLKKVRSAPESILSILLLHVRYHPVLPAAYSSSVASPKHPIGIYPKPSDYIPPKEAGKVLARKYRLDIASSDLDPRWEMKRWCTFKSITLCSMLWNWGGSRPGLHWEACGQYVPYSGSAASG
ncbi:hypothetical protein C8R43DRAFT_1242636 [Mycena crocata]|nr:hypothetical protein C8R43DRAFT_1242636 [Mycena crocata]